MVPRPKQSEAIYLVYAGLVIAAIAPILWLTFFMLMSWSLPGGDYARLPLSQMPSCMRVWNFGECMHAFYRALGTAPIDLTRKLWLIITTGVAGLACVLVGGFVALFIPKPAALKSGRAVSGIANLLKAAKKEKIVNRDGLHWFNGWRMSLERETRHFMIFGGIGGGKTTAIIHLILSAIARRDKVLAFDYKGDLTKGLPNTVAPDGTVTEPLLLAPQDKRSAVWDIAKDLMVPEDAIELAARLIPRDERQPFFSSSARSVLAACIVRLMHDRPGQWTWADMYRESQRSHKELLEIAIDYHPDAVRYLEADYRQVSGTLSSLQSESTTLRLLANAWQDYEDRERFSLRHWLLYKTDRRTVILQRSGRFKVQSDAWTSAFFTIASAIVSDPELGDAPLRRIWFFIDEFSQLPHISGFSSFLDTGRSKGVCVCLGIQDIAQIRDTYGPEQADSWLSIVGTKLIARVNSGPTAQRLSDDIGKATVVYTRREGGNSGSRYDRDEREEYTVKASELETMLGPHKRGINVLITGIGPDVYKVTIPYTKLEQVRSAQKAAAWTYEFTLPNKHSANGDVEPSAEKKGDEEKSGSSRLYEQADLKHLEGIDKPKGVPERVQATSADKSVNEAGEPDLFDGV